MDFFEENISKKEVLTVKIHSCSSFASDFIPENILVDNPSSQDSRWASKTTSIPQYIILKLERPAIVTHILFGKYQQSHVCNAKKLKVFGGLEENKMMLLFDGGLKNDANNETFELQHKIDNFYYPSLLIKIQPIEAYSSSFNFSIWFVQLSGIVDTSLIKESIKSFRNYTQHQATRLCLKHLRNTGQLEIFEELQKRTKIQLEHPLLTDLFNSITHYDFEKCEKVIDIAFNNKMFEEYISKLNYKINWSLLNTREKPSMRGGHQMIMDPVSNCLYLHGGWNGSHDLGDFWVYNITKMKWNEISSDTSLEGGPSPRSCHKIALDYNKRQLFFFGRYLDSSSRTEDSLQAELFVYDIERKEWNIVQNDSAAVNGPHLLYDHQMVIDSNSHILYVFGGKIIRRIDETNKYNQLDYSGLFSYNIPVSVWTQIRPECNELPSRVCHSMVFHPDTKHLYIIGGQRLKVALLDVISYDTINDTVKNISWEYDKVGQCPLIECCTQRSTINPSTNEIIVLTGSVKEDRTVMGPDNLIRPIKLDKSNANAISVWLFSLKTNKWYCIDKSINKKSKNSIAPFPRYAHQLVFDPINETHYLFGGNAGSDKIRLNDFWSFKLNKLSDDDIRLKCKFILRQSRYHELAKNHPVQAIKYLQSELNDELFNNCNHAQLKNLATSLFENSNDTSDDIQIDYGLTDTEKRFKLFEQLCSFFPQSMTQPHNSIDDFVKY